MQQTILELPFLHQYLLCYMHIILRKIIIKIIIISIVIYSIWLAGHSLLTSCFRLKPTIPENVIFLQEKSIFKFLFISLCLKLEEEKKNKKLLLWNLTCCRQTTKKGFSFILIEYQ